MDLEKRLAFLEKSLKRKAKQDENLEALERSIAGLKEEITQMGQAFTEQTKLVHDVITKLEKGISSMNWNPVIKVAAAPVTVQTKAPIVKVATPVDPDVYARYKRAKSSIDPDGVYHGFLDTDGHWFLQRETDNGKLASSNFYVGKGTFEEEWLKRTGFDYVPFNEVNIR